MTAGTDVRSIRGMEVHLTPEQEARLSEIAADEGKDKELLVREAVLRLLVDNDHLLEMLDVGIAQANRGEFIEEEEMDARVQRMLGR